MSPEERESFRKTSLVTFQRLVEELDERKSEFEKRLFDSVEVKEKATAIQTALIPEKNYYLYEDSMYPVLSKTVSEIKRLEPLSDGRRVFKTEFKKKSYSELKDLEGRIFEANVVGNKKYYDVNVKLEPDERYILKMYIPYRAF